MATFDLHPGERLIRPTDPNLQYMGRIDDGLMNRLDGALAVSFGLETT